MRIEVEAGEIPPHVPAAALVTVVHYGKVTIGGNDIWLPQTSDVLLTHTSGRQEQNRTHYTHCRAYTAESVIRLEEAPAAEQTPAAKPVTEIQLPAGLNISIDLQTEIDSAKASVGDLLVATTQEEIRARSGIVIPKGAEVHGRLRLLERDAEPTPHFTVGIEFTEIEFGNYRALFYAQLQKLPHLAGLETMLAGDKSTSRNNYGWGLATTVKSEMQYVPVLAGTGTFFVRGNSFRLPRGLRMLWRTQEPRR